MSACDFPILLTLQVDNMLSSFPLSGRDMRNWLTLQATIASLPRSFWSHFPRLLLLRTAGHSIRQALPRRRPMTSSSSSWWPSISVTCCRHRQRLHGSM